LIFRFSKGAQLAIVDLDKMKTELVEIKEVARFRIRMVLMEVYGVHGD
jgi:hypothetical protein